MKIFTASLTGWFACIENVVRLTRVQRILCVSDWRRPLSLDARYGKSVAYRKHHSVKAVILRQPPIELAHRFHRRVPNVWIEHSVAEEDIVCCNNGSGTGKTQRVVQVVWIVFLISVNKEKVKPGSLLDQCGQAGAGVPNPVLDGV